MIGNFYWLSYNDTYIKVLLQILLKPIITALGIVAASFFAFFSKKDIADSPTPCG